MSQFQSLSRATFTLGKYPRIALCAQALLFIAASFFSLLLALTVGLFGITVTWGYTLAALTFVIEGIGVIVLAMTLALVLRARRTV